MIKTALLKVSFSHKISPKMAMPSPKAEAVKRFREATGMGWMESKLFLAEKSPELSERILDARAQQPEATTLHDPIEDHPEYAEIFETIRNEIESELRDEIAQRNAERRASGDKTVQRNWPLGTSHLMWERMKERLAEMGIDRYSLAELNLGHRFD